MLPEEDWEEEWEEDWEEDEWWLAEEELIHELEEE